MPYSQGFIKFIKIGNVLNVLFISALYNDCQLFYSDSYQSVAAFDVQCVEINIPAFFVPLSLAVILSDVEQLVSLPFVGILWVGDAG